jgi:hypothetical protein
MALKRPHLAELNRVRATHRASKDPLFLSWCEMRARCGNPNHRDYPSYGGRGITVCARWNEFAYFLADMGERPQGHSLGRIDNDRGYSPDNCRWESREQQNNNRRSNRLLTIKGRTQTVTQWAGDPACCVALKTFRDRIRKGWPAERALTQPTRSKSC